MGIFDRRVEATHRLSFVIDPGVAYLLSPFACRSIRIGTFLLECLPFGFPCKYGFDNCALGSVWNRHLLDVKLHRRKKGGLDSASALI